MNIANEIANIKSRRQKILFVGVFVITVPFLVIVFKERAPMILVENMRALIFGGFAGLAALVYYDHRLAKKMQSLLQSQFENQLPAFAKTAMPAGGQGPALAVLWNLEKLFGIRTVQTQEFLLAPEQRWGLFRGLKGAGKHSHEIAGLYIVTELPPRISSQASWVAEPVINKHAFGMLAVLPVVLFTVLQGDLQTVLTWTLASAAVIGVFLFLLHTKPSSLPFLFRFTSNAVPADYEERARRAYLRTVETMNQFSTYGEISQSRLIVALEHKSADPSALDAQAAQKVVQQLRFLWQDLA